MNQSILEAMRQLHYAFQDAGLETPSLFFTTNKAGERFVNAMSSDEEPPLPVKLRMRNGRTQHYADECSINGVRVIWPSRIVGSFEL